MACRERAPRRVIWLFSAAALATGCPGDGGSGDGDTAPTTGIPPGDGGSSSATSTGGTTTLDPDGTGDGSEDTGPMGQACDASAQCPGEQVCANSVCTDPDGMCSDDGECTGDTYCCAEGCLPDGEPGGWCVPFGPGEVNEACLGEVVIGLFEPDVQCEWLAPPAGDPFPNHINVLTTPLAADLPLDSGVAGEIVIVTYNCQDGGAAAGWGSDPNCFGVIRVLNGQTCEIVDTIDEPSARVVAASPPAIGDLDGDGSPEIVTQRAVSGLVAFTFDPAQQRYVTMWTTVDSNISSATRWDGPSIHDLDNDGFPEVISGSEVYEGAAGGRLNPGQVLPAGGANVFSVVGDLDADGAIEIVADEVYRWNIAGNQWELAYPGGAGGRHYGFADFGTPGPTPAEFNPNVLDGQAEIVEVSVGAVALYTLSGQQLMSVGGIAGGGPPTIGDFDNDGLPEIASAGGSFYRVFDLECAAGAAPCAAPYVRWIQPSQDLSSSTTGSSIFDFEGDGAAEAVYGDECFTRVYDGATGAVLYSAARTSCTWYENPIVADPDNDDKSEILVGSNTNCTVTCPAIDPIHEGSRCETGEDCDSGSCVAGFCRCVDDTECAEGLVCATPLPQTPPGGNTCRASHPPDIALSGVRVLRDRLDRWASSRNQWNQHAYSITNIEDDLSVPSTGLWQQNFLDPALNNYRQNRQGDALAEELPDITGELEDTACTFEGTDVTLEGTVCNRGLSTVAAALPATFYLGDPSEGNILCVAYTAEPVPVGECREVSCPIDNMLSGIVTMVVNDDGMGGALTVECIDTNNTDVVEIAECVPPG